MSSPLPVYYTVAEVASTLRVKPIAVYDLIKSGRLKATKPPGQLRYLISEETLLAHLAAGEDVA
jgi:excisionase family DNA binding protein